MASRNVIRKEDIMYFSFIPAYMVYDGFNQDITAALVYKRLRDIQHDSPMQDHVPEFLYFYMVEICRNADKNPLPHTASSTEFYHLRLGCGRNSGLNKSYLPLRRSQAQGSHHQCPRQHHRGTYINLFREEG